MKRIYHRVQEQNLRNQQVIQSSFEPGKPNKIQHWCTAFIEDPTPFVLTIEGRPTTICRKKIAAKMLEMGQLYMDQMNTRQIPRGFFRTTVLPEVVRNLTGR